MFVKCSQSSMTLPVTQVAPAATIVRNFDNLGLRGFMMALYLKKDIWLFWFRYTYVAIHFLLYMFYHCLILHVSKENPIQQCRATVKYFGPGEIYTLEIRNQHQVLSPSPVH